MSSTCLDAALEYLNAGLTPVVLTSPLDSTEPDFKKRGKMPLNAIGWTEKPIPTEQELRSDFARSPLSNIGLRTGIKSGARVPIIGFDIDGDCMGIWDAAILQASEEIRRLVDSTWMIRTGEGKRPIFSVNRSEWPDGVPSTKILKGIGDHDEIALLGDGRHSVAPPSIHPIRRTNYSSNDKPIQPITRSQVDEIIRLLNRLNPTKDEETDSDRDHTPMEELFKPGAKFHDGEERHVKVRRVIIHLVRKNAGILPQDKIKELANDWNKEHCNPPLTNANFNKRWSDAIKWLRSHSELIEKNSPEPEFASKYKQLADKYGIGDEMLKHVGAIIRDSPPQLVIANTDDKRVKIGNIKKIEKKNDQGEVEETFYKLQYTDTILDAIPESITIIKDPLEDSTKYEVELVSANGEVHRFGPLPFTDVIDKIEDTPLCFKPRSLQSYLAPLLRAYIESGRVDHKTEIDREGFFYVDGKLQGSRVEIRPVTSAQAKQAVGFIETLKTEFYSKQRDTARLAHCLRLAVVAPFDFARRQMGVAGNNNFIPRLDQYGWANTGKTYGYPKVILRIWRREVEDYLKGNGSVDTAARFIKQTGFSTFPLVLDEVDFTTNWEKDGRVQNYIAILKNQCSMTHPRDTLTKESEIVARPSLAFPILTHNSDRITEDGFVKRYVGFGYTPDDEISKTREEIFTKFLEENKDSHGVIGDFIAGYIVAHQDSLTKSWDEIAENTLKALYELANETAPAWLWSKVEHNALDDTKEIRVGQVKAALWDMINSAWAQNRSEIADPKTKDASGNWVNQTHTLEDKIDRLLSNNMLPHIRLHKTEGYCLLSTFVEALKDKYHITRISMDQLASMCGWERKPVRLGDNGSSKTTKVIRVPQERFFAFLRDESIQAQVT
jgi:hypothetical protein